MFIIYGILLISLDLMQYPDALAELAIPFVIGIMALSFPLIFSALTRMDEKYQSDIIPNKLREEDCYKQFIYALIFSVVTAFVYAFIHFIFESFIYNERIFCISQFVGILLVIFTIILLVTTFKLLKLINEYNNPKTMILHYGHDEQIRLVVLKYAAMKHNADLFDMAYNQYSRADKNEIIKALLEVVPELRGIEMEQKIGEIMSDNQICSAEFIRLFFILAPNHDAAIQMYLYRMHSKAENRKPDECLAALNGKGNWEKIQNQIECKWFHLILLSHLFIIGKYRILEELYMTIQKGGLIMVESPFTPSFIDVIYLRMFTLLKKNHYIQTLTIDIDDKEKNLKEKRCHDVDMFFAFLILYLYQTSYIAGESFYYSLVSLNDVLYDMSSLFKINEVIWKNDSIVDTFQLRSRACGESENSELGQFNNTIEDLFIKSYNIKYRDINISQNVLDDTLSLIQMRFENRMGFEAISIEPKMFAKFGNRSRNDVCLINFFEKKKLVKDGEIWDFELEKSINALLDEVYSRIIDDISRFVEHKICNDATALVTQLISFVNLKPNYFIYIPHKHILLGQQIIEQSKSAISIDHLRYYGGETGILVICDVKPIIISTKTKFYKEHKIQHKMSRPYELSWGQQIEKDMNYYYSFNTSMQVYYPSDSKNIACFVLKE